MNAKYNRIYSYVLIFRLFRNKVCGYNLITITFEKFKKKKLKVFKKYYDKFVSIIK